MSEWLKNCKECCLALGLAVFAGLFLLPLSLGSLAESALLVLAGQLDPLVGPQGEMAAIIILVVVSLITLLVLGLLIALVVTLIKVAKKACKEKRKDCC